jgi:hypothetical protein
MHLYHQFQFKSISTLALMLISCQLVKLLQSHEELEFIIDIMRVCSACPYILCCILVVKFFLCSISHVLCLQNMSVVMMNNFVVRVDKEHGVSLVASASALLKCSSSNAQSKYIIGRCLKL